MSIIYVLGGGAVGLALAAHLAGEGRRAILVRTSRHDIPAGLVTLKVHGPADSTLEARVETISFAQMDRLDGILVVATKSHANAALAAGLRGKAARGPLVLLQNGLSVESSFLEEGFTDVHRGVLYMTAQLPAENEVTFRAITSSPIGIVNGTGLEDCVKALATTGFPFHAEENIQRDIWKKAIMNAVFNSICPLLDMDNGVFARSAEAAGIAAQIIRECAALASARGVSLPADELMEQVFRISRGSQGVLISTLQDINNGRPTEIESLNLEMARIAASLEPAIDLTCTELLGRMVLVKSRL